MKMTIIGCGSMGSALAKVLAKKQKLVLLDRDYVNTAVFAKEIGASAAKDLSQAVQKVDAVLIAVKPNNFEELARQLGPLLDEGVLVLSVVAGVRHADLKRFFPKQESLSIMPNIAVAHGKGIVGVVESPDLTPELKERAQDLFSDAGIVLFLPEKKIDALAALASSSLAFVFHLIESMTDGGVFLGFPSRQALDLTIGAFEGALAILKEGKELPQALKWKVASPGGTTIEGLKVLEKERVHYALMEALHATYLKAQKLQ